MKSPHLIRPSTKYKQSFIDAVKEHHKEGLPQYEKLNIKDLENDFDKYIEEILGWTEKENLPKDYVPMTRFWLVDDGEYIGRFDIRHELTEHLKKEGGHIGYDIRPSKRRQGYGSLGLKLTLQKAKELGFDKALVTCDDTNLGSAKIIKKNGGVLQDKIPIADDKPLKRRYWIEL